MATGWIGWRPERRGWRLGLGVGMVVVGLLALSAMPAVGMLSVALLGLALMFAGGLAVIGIFTSDGLAEALVMIILATMLIITGAALVVDPVRGLVAATTLIGTYLVLSGVARIVIALFDGRGHRGLRILHGLVNLLLGALIWAEWPLSGLVTVGLYVGIELIVIGISWVFGARAVPQAPQKPQLLQAHKAQKSQKSHKAKARRH